MPRRSLIRSFADAFAGFAETWLSERNMRIHTFLALLALAAGRLGALSRWEWLLLSLLIALVFAGELINTAIEATVDLCTQDMKPLARTAKNAAAAAVLAVAAGAVAAGWCLFAPRLAAYPAAWRAWWRTRPGEAGAWTVVTLAVAWLAFVPGRAKPRR